MCMGWGCVCGDGGGGGCPTQWGRWRRQATSTCCQTKFKSHIHTRLDTFCDRHIHYDDIFLYYRASPLPGIKSILTLLTVIAHTRKIGTTTGAF